MCSGKRNHRSSEVKKRGEMREEGVKLKGWIQKKRTCSACLEMQEINSSAMFVRFEEGKDKIGAS